MLHEALLQTECPICLQPLSYHVRPPPPSRPASPLLSLPGASNGSTPSPSTITSSSSLPLHSPGTGSTVHSPNSLPYRDAVGAGNGGTASTFRITFAPGVYGSDAADPWHPALAVPTFAAEPDFTGSAESRSVLNSPQTFTDEGEEGESKDTAERNDDAPATEESASGVAVLPCGHLLHYLCALQLCEYATKPSCPVCRTKLTSAADLLPFCPRARVPSWTPSVQPKHTETVLFSSSSSALPSSRRTKVGCSISGQPPLTEVGREDAEESSNSVTVVSNTQPGTQDEAEPIEEEEEREEPYIVHGVASELSVTAGKEEDDNDVNDGARLGAAGEEEANSLSVHPPNSMVLEGGRSSTVHVAAAPVTAGVADAPSSDRTRNPSRPHQRTRPPSHLKRTRSASEDGILILGARQLPPSQAYAELLLRTTATWADRTETLKTRVAHLERSQQQLQSDCTELGRTLTAARRRREVLLDLPFSNGNGASTSSLSSSTEEQAALRASERLQELRRLCVDTRKAMTETTAQLAESTRANADVRRQVEKYTRKLSRVRGGHGTDGAVGEAPAAGRDHGTERRAGETLPLNRSGHLHRSSGDERRDGEAPRDRARGGDAMGGSTAEPHEV